MKYFVTIEGNEHTVELVERLGRLEVSFDGEAVDVRYEEVDHLGQVALFDGLRAFGVSIEGDSAHAIVNVAGHEYPVDIEDERERAAHSAERGGTKQGGPIKSVMPGVVVDVMVAAGERVEKDQPLLILEAMKMQNEIRADRPGIVKSIHVQKGVAVGNGEKLVTLQAPPEPDSES